ncbi:cytochrome P450 2J6-like [Uloborus diversus]|uniref:cytochrome P450 2J6-like n=1 Tax=Uloborus diversus TaxID=327109 RepID=UPI00240967A1|nr:cytochrome P450 2J6-like [Uloborus diversus]
MDLFRNPNFVTKYIDFDKYGYQILLTGVLVFLTAIYLSLGKKRKLPPGPYGIPYIGYFPFLGEKPYETFHKLSKKYGSVFSINLGGHLVVILNDWESVKEAFSKAETANRPENFFDIIPNGLGLGGVNGAEWVEQRRFSVKAMKDIGFGRTRWEELVQEELKEVVEMMKKHGTAPLDVRKFFTSTFTNNVLTLIFGHRLPIGHPDTELVSQCVDAVSNSLPSLGLNVFLPKLSDFLTFLGLTRQSLNFETILKFTNFATKAIQEKQDKMEDSASDSFVDEYVNEIRRNALKNKETSFSERHLRGNTQALLIGGSETSRTTLVFILISMAEHQETQKRVQEELDNVLGKEGTLRWADRTRVPYTFATIMEAMRWRSVVPINTLRMTSEDIKISGYDIPKHTAIVANNWALHNDPKYWNNPERFIPERFLLDDGKQVNFKPDSYVPFSFGKRSCPGELIAMMEILLYFTTLMQKFTVLPEEGQKVKYNTILGLTFQATDVKLRFIPRG